MMVVHPPNFGDVYANVYGEHIKNTGKGSRTCSGRS